MANNPDAVVIELEAKLDAFNAAVKRGEVQFDENMVRIAQSAGRAEQAISGALGKVDKPFLNAATRSRQLGIQIGQLGSSLGSGMNPMTVFAQQAQDFTYVLGGTGGAAGKLATFFSGPWGAALLAAGIVVGTLASKVDFFGNKLDDAVDKLKQHAAQEALGEQANRVFANSIEGIANAARKTQDALDKLNDSQKSQTRLALEGALASIERAKNLRNETQQLLIAAQAQYAYEESSARSPQERDISAARVRQAGEEIARLTGLLQQTDSQIRDQQTRVNELTAKFVAERISENADPVQRIHNLADKAVEAETKRVVATGLVGAALEKEIAKRTEIIRLQEQSDAKAAQAANRTSRAVEGAQQVASFIMPVEGRISSGFGPRRPPTRGASSFHPAIDIAAPSGTPVKAAAGGVVVTAGRLGTLGNVVIVDHGGGTISEYGHLSAILAKTGQRVGQGDVIGQVGSTGVSTGPHLDFRVRVGGRYVDPRGGKFPVDELAAGTKANQLAEQAERQAQQAAAREGAFQRELAGLESKYLQTQRTKLLSADEALTLSEQQIIHDRDTANASYEAAVKSGRIDAAQAQLLTEKNNQLATARTMRLYDDEGVRKAKLAAALDEQRRQETVSQLEFEVSNAKTGSDRRDAMLRLLDAETELARIKLQAVVDATAEGTAEHELAQLKLSQLNSERNRRAAAIATDPRAMTPGQGYVQELSRTAGQIGEDIEKVAVSGMQRLNDELAEATLGFLGLGKASHTFAGQIVADLARIAIQQAIIKPLASALFGGNGWGGGGLGGIISGIGSLFGGGGTSFAMDQTFFGVSGYATGGRPPVGQVSMVGEKGPELFVPDSAGTIVPNSSLMSGGQLNGSITVHVVSDDDKFAAFIGQVTDPRIASASMQAARAGSMITRQLLLQSQIHQLG